MEGPPPSHPGLSESQVLLLPARLTRLLESNEVPLDTEIPTIREIISENQARVDALNARSGLPTAMEQLITERDKITDNIRRHTAVISPLRRMPSELIGEIFSLTQCTRRIGGGFVTCPPWRLGHVCRFWRHSALSIPLLWSSIEVSQTPRNIPLIDAYPPSMIETLLLWSGNVPLHVSVSDWWSDTHGHLFDLLLLHCERWSTVSFYLPREHHASLVSRLNAVHGRIPQLKKLQFTADIHYPDVEHDFLSLSPNLCGIILTDPGLNAWSPHLLVPWSQITHYRGSYLAKKQMDILQATPNLVECGIGNYNHGGEGFAGREATLPHLRRLYVMDSFVLAYLTTPMLQDLFLGGTYMLPTRLPTMASVLPFVRRSMCRLTKLVLASCGDPGELVSVLECLPSLESLAFVHAGDTITVPELIFVWTAMTVSDSQSDLCPNLTSLACAKREIGFCRDVFFNMIRSRLQSTSHIRLSFLRILSDLWAMGQSDETDERVAQLEDEFEGFDVAVLFFTERPALM
ncbi:hypothetical protein B0H11DRAFT_2008818 [Mycena galericulata]|nr:hypothetical protein B0H11DRAFT_2008818 [Mycena galericulata]